MFILFLCIIFYFLTSQTHLYLNDFDFYTAVTFRTKERYECSSKDNKENVSVLVTGPGQDENRNNYQGPVPGKENPEGRSCFRSVSVFIQPLSRRGLKTSFS